MEVALKRNTVTGDWTDGSKRPVDLDAVTIDGVLSNLHVVRMPEGTFLLRDEMLRILRDPLTSDEVVDVVKSSRSYRVQ